MNEEEKEGEEIKVEEPVATEEAVGVPVKETAETPVREDDAKPVEPKVESVPEARETQQITPQVEVPKGIFDTLPNVTVERAGDTVTITEVMAPPKPAEISTTSVQNFGVSKKELWQRFLDKISFRKRKRLDKIMTLATQKGKIKNDDVEKLLRVSDSTAQRYLKELARSGKLKLSGKGSETGYELI